MNAMNINDWVPASDPRGYGDDRVIGTHNVQEDDIAGDGSELERGHSPGTFPTRIPGLTRDRVEEIHRRIEDGTYLSEAMAEQVAKKMIARGEF